MFHRHRWEFVGQTLRPESRGNQLPFGECTIEEKINKFRCVGCQKQAWQPAYHPYCAFMEGTQIAVIRSASFKID